MERHGIAEDEAFERLRRQARDTRRPIMGVVEDCSGSRGVSTGPTPAGDVLSSTTGGPAPCFERNCRSRRATMLVAAAIRQMARDLRAHERRSAARRRTRCSTAPPPACATGSGAARRRPRSRATGGLDVEDVLDEISRSRRGPQGFEPESAAGGALGFGAPRRVVAPRRHPALRRRTAAHDRGRAPPRRPAPRSCARSCATSPRRSTPRSRSPPRSTRAAGSAPACSPRTAATASSSPRATSTRSPARRASSRATATSWRSPAAPPPPSRATRSSPATGSRATWRSSSAAADGARLGYLGVMSARELDAGEEAIAVLRDLRLARRGRDRAPPPRGRAARPRGARSPPRAPGWSRSPTRSAAGSAATSTTARSSG